GLSAALTEDDVEQREEIFVVDLLLLLREALERFEEEIERGILEVPAELARARPERAPSAVLAEDELRALGAYVARLADLVRAGVLQHSSLVGAGFVRERVLADDRLVALDLEPCHFGQKATRRHQELGSHAGLEVEAIAPGPQRHHDLFERTVARALADAVD